MRELLKQEQVSGEWNIPERTLERWRYEGEGPPYLRIRRAIRYDRQAVEAWLDSQAVDTQATA